MKILTRNSGPSGRCKIIDKVDQKIIQELRENAYISNKAISKKLGMSQSTIGRRLDRLIKEQIIQIKAIIHDPSKLGLPVVAQIAFDIDHDKMAAVVDTVKQKENIQWMAVTSGRYDAMASAWASSNEELYTLLGELAKIEGVRNLETFICLQNIKMV